MVTCRWLLSRVALRCVLCSALTSPCPAALPCAVLEMSSATLLRVGQRHWLCPGSHGATGRHASDLKCLFTGSVISLPCFQTYLGLLVVSTALVEGLLGRANSPSRQAPCARLRWVGRAEVRL